MEGQRHWSDLEERRRLFKGPVVHENPSFQKIVTSKCVCPFQAYYYCHKSKNLVLLLPLFELQCIVQSLN